MDFYIHLCFLYVTNMLSSLFQGSELWVYFTFIVSHPFNTMFFCNTHYVLLCVLLCGNIHFTNSGNYCKVV